MSETYSIIYKRNGVEETIMAGLDDETTNDAIVGIYDSMKKEGKYIKCLLSCDQTEEENFKIYAEDCNFNTFEYHAKKDEVADTLLSKQLKKVGLI